MVHADDFPQNPRVHKDQGAVGQDESEYRVQHTQCKHDISLVSKALAHEQAVGGSRFAGPEGVEVEQHREHNQAGHGASYPPWIAGLPSECSCIR